MSHDGRYEQDPKGILLELAVIVIVRLVLQSVHFLVLLDVLDLLACVSMGDLTRDIDPKPIA